MLSDVWAEPAPSAPMSITAVGAAIAAFAGELAATISNVAYWR